MVAKPVNTSLSAVQRIWEAHRLQPHRTRTFKRSNDPAFAAKVEDIVGLYMNPPAHAVVVSIDEKSQIQALDRTQPGLPLKPGRCGTMTHDYKRHGTTTLFAALNILDGTVVGRCMPKHTQGEVEHPARMFCQPRLDLRMFVRGVVVGDGMDELARRDGALDGVQELDELLIPSVADLQDAIRRYIRLHNRDPKPFVWTKPADGILAKLSRLPAS